MEGYSGFSNKASYVRMNVISNAGTQLDELTLGELDRVWKSNVLNKIHLFCWRLVLKMLPTRVELARREVINGIHNIVCHMCFNIDEMAHRLFLRCSVLVQVWRKLHSWIVIPLRVET